MFDSVKFGKELRFHVPADYPRLNDGLDFFKVLLSREFNPLKKIFVEKINGKDALSSEYAGILRGLGTVSAYNGLELRKKY